MAFKPSPDKKVRLESLSKKALVATVKTLQRRERVLLNQVAKLEGEARGREARHEYEEAKLQTRVAELADALRHKDLTHNASGADASEQPAWGPVVHGSQSAGPFPWEQSK